jgi:hypothetical protein
MAKEKRFHDTKAKLTIDAPARQNTSAVGHVISLKICILKILPSKILDANLARAPLQGQDNQTLGKRRQTAAPPNS